MIVTDFIFFFQYLSFMSFKKNEVGKLFYTFFYLSN